MKIQRLLLSLSAVLTIGYGLHRFSTYLYFEDIASGQPVPGTDFVYDFRDVDVVATGPFSQGETFKRTEVYLVNTKTDTRFEVPARFSFEETSEGGICRSCVAVVEADDRVYLVTRAYGGGSGGYYAHLLLDVTGESVVNQGQYLSCGWVYARNNQLTFPNHKVSCPELLPKWSGWEYRNFGLSEG